MYVCVCNKVTDRQIRRACRDGVDSFEGLQSRLKVATCCGRCQDCAKRVLDESMMPGMTAMPVEMSPVAA